MEQKIVPNLWFDTEAEQAAEFYVSVFPGSRILRVARYPDGAPGPAGTVMTVEFELFGQPFVGINGGPEFSFTEAVSFQIPCADQAEVDHYWEVLSEGGEPGPCGWLKDRYGVSWQIIPKLLEELLQDEDRARADAVMKAMLRMGKIESAELQRAYDEAA